MAKGRKHKLKVSQPGDGEANAQTGINSQAKTSCDELKELGAWKAGSMAERYAKFATENLTAALRLGSRKRSVSALARWRHVPVTAWKLKKGLHRCKPFECLVEHEWLEHSTYGLKVCSLKMLMQHFTRR
ncbi:hypothetical protein [Cupriavidus necator]